MGRLDFSCDVSQDLVAFASPFPIKLSALTKENGMEEWNVGNLQGLIPILGGLYGFLLAQGTLPRNPRDPEKMAQWRERFGPLMKVLCPLVIVHGALQLLGVYPG